MTILYGIIEGIYYREGKSAYCAYPSSKYELHIRTLTKRIKCKVSLPSGLLHCTLMYGDILYALMEDLVVTEVKAIYVVTFERTINHNEGDHINVPWFIQTFVKPKKQSDRVESKKDYKVRYMKWRSDLENIDIHSLDSVYDSKGLATPYDLPKASYDHTFEGGTSVRSQGRREHIELASRILEVWRVQHIERALIGIGINPKDIPYVDRRGYLTLRLQAMSEPWNIPFFSDSTYDNITNRLDIDTTDKEDFIAYSLHRMWTEQIECSATLISESRLKSIISSSKYGIETLLESEQVVYATIKGRSGYTLVYVRDLNNQVADAVSKVVSYQGKRIVDLPEEITSMSNLPNTHVTLSRLTSMPISCVTGAAGTGKSTLVASIIETSLLLGHKVLLTSFTGRAVLRVKDIISNKLPDLCNYVDFRTMHSSIRAYMRSYDLIVIDEMSMVHLELLAAFMKYHTSNKKKPKFMFVGDTNQLPPVKGASVFSRMIQNFPVLSLTEVHRAQYNALTQLSQAVLSASNLQDALSVKSEGLSVVSKLNVSDAYADLTREYGKGNVAVLTYTNSNVDSYNNAILDRVWQGNMLQEGVPVMAIHNIMSKGVANGSIGRIYHVGDNEVHIQFASRFVFAGLDANSDIPFHTYFKLACAFTIHKSQGCEWKAVILVLGSNRFTRELLYTAITRASNKLVIVCPNMKVLHACVRNKARKSLIPLSSMS